MIRMAVRARRQLRRTRIHAVHRACSHRAVALVAQHVDVRHIQHPRILRTVRRVATHASLALHRRVLVDKRPALLCVALGADQVRIVPRPQVVLLECAVHIVAVAALHQALVHLVVVGHIELRLLVGVALEAERRLSGLQQLLLLAVVDVVAADAATLALACGER